jgi:anti-sigma factor RsiW
VIHHLHEDRLFECYVSERSGERVDPPAAEHLADCAECARRYWELAGFMDGVRAEGEAEADEIFTPERLRAQQQQVAARIAHLGHAARVISFPRRFAAGAERRVPRIATRWLAAAAAAGMFIGVGTGIFLESGSRERAPRTATLTRPTHLNASAATRLAPSDPTDDSFLSDLEVALDRPRTRELLPFDALTPHVREVANVR